MAGWYVPAGAVLLGWAAAVVGEPKADQVSCTDLCPPTPAQVSALLLPRQVMPLDLHPRASLRLQQQVVVVVRLERR